MHPQLSQRVLRVEPVWVWVATKMSHCHQMYRLSDRCVCYSLLCKSQQTFIYFLHQLSDTEGLSIVPLCKR